MRKKLKELKTIVAVDKRIALWSRRKVKAEANVAKFALRIERANTYKATLPVVE